MLILGGEALVEFGEQQLRLRVRGATFTLKTGEMLVICEGCGRQIGEHTPQIEIRGVELRNPVASCSSQTGDGLDRPNQFGSIDRSMGSWCSPAIENPEDRCL
jgi:hypothetical protein